MFPMIFFVDEIPDWILSSNTAAYHPRTNKIWIRKDRPWLIMHELTHWVAHKIWGNGSSIHKWIDHGKINYV
jgi:hypothetical protein